MTVPGYSTKSADRYCESESKELFVVLSIIVTWLLMVECELSRSEVATLKVAQCIGFVQTRINGIEIWITRDCTEI